MKSPFEEAEEEALRLSLAAVQVLVFFLAIMLYATVSQQ